MPNTVSSTLLTNRLVQIGISTLQSRLAPLSAFTSSFSTDPVKPDAKLEVTLVTAAPATKTNATDWEASSDSTASAVEIDPTLYSQSFHLDSAEIQSGTRLEALAAKNLNTFADKIMDVALAPVTSSNYSTGFTGGAAIFNAAEVGNFAATINGNRALVLDPTYYFKLSGGLGFSAGGVATMPGFVNGVHENSRWTGAGANVVGFCCAPEALAVASGLPLDPPRSAADKLVTSGTILVPGIKLTVAFYAWANPRYRQLFFSYDVMFGSKEADTGSLKLIKSA